MSSNIELSIIIPVYNSEKFLIPCLESIRKQSFLDYECIIVNDGSTDGSREICEEYVKCDTRFKLFNQENQGVSAARNFGIEKATGKWISFVDSDDWIDINTYEIAIKTCEETNSELVQWGIDFNLNGISQNTLSYKNKVFDLKEDICYWSPSSCNKLIKNTLLKNNDIRFPVGVAYSEDTLFSFKCYYYSYKCFAIPNVLYHYRMNDNSVTHNLDEKHIREDIDTVRTLEFFLCQNNEIEDWKDFLKFKKFVTKKNIIFLSKQIDFTLVRASFPEINWKLPNTSLKDKIIFILLNLHFDFILILAKRIKDKK